MPFFWSHFLLSWSQSCAKTQKFRRKKKEVIFEAGQLLHHPNTNIINENDSKLLFLAMKIDGKQKKKKDLLERSWAHCILMKPGEEAVGDVE